MSLVEIGEACFIGRGAAGWWHRALAPLLVLVVMVGGVCPALYGSQIPHAHLFVGGSPPPGWESHEHDNPLLTFFGPPVRSLDARQTEPGLQPSSQSTQTTPPASRATPSSPGGRVVSVYSGSTVLVVTVLAITGLAPTPPDPRGASLSSPVAPLQSDFIAHFGEGPPLPPPRLG